MSRAFANSVVGTLWFRSTPQERRERRITRPGFWSVPTRRAEDLATTILPRLLYERMEEIGLDYTILYPGLGIGAIHLGEEELRRASCRALNRMFADLYRGFADAMTPAGLIPMHTPAEAIEELEFAVGQLGLKGGDGSLGHPRVGPVPPPEVEVPGASDAGHDRGEDAFLLLRGKGRWVGGRSDTQAFPAPQERPGGLLLSHGYRDIREQLLHRLVSQPLPGRLPHAVRVSVSRAVTGAPGRK